MIPLLDGLPDCVAVGGCEYKIITDHVSWMRFEQLLTDDDLTDYERIALMMEWYMERPEDVSEAISALLVFMCMGEITETGKATARVYDYEKDAAMIYAAFRQAYNINLAKTKLHWWEFRALLINLPNETLMAHTMSIRGMDTSEMGKEERARYEKLKSIVALSKEPRYTTLKDRDAALLEKMQDRATKRKNKSGV